MGSAVPVTGRKAMAQPATMTGLPEPVTHAGTSSVSCACRRHRPAYVTDRPARPVHRRVRSFVASGAPGAYRRTGPRVTA
jgi:hypothetical protein